MPIYRALRILFLLVVLLPVGSGCGGTASPNDEIRAAIDKHLATQGTLNLEAFNTEIQKVTVQGDQAQADVVFRLKDGPGMMQLGYTLQKAGGNWAVVQSNPVGSNFEHPSLDGTGSAAPGLPPSGTAPDIFDTIHQRMRTPPPENPGTGAGQPR